MSMGDSNGDQMKDYISLTEELLACYAAVTRPETVYIEQIVEQNMPTEHPILSDCRDLVFKLRSTMENDAGEYALGVEMGMQRAADMIENLVRRFEKGDDFER
jgi:hypothetical protein